MTQGYEYDEIGKVLKPKGYFWEVALVEEFGRPDSVDICQWAPVLANPDTTDRRDYEPVEMMTVSMEDLTKLIPLFQAAHRKYSKKSAR